MTMGSHQSAKMKTDCWLTPPEIIKALGEFDLDPCCPSEMPWKTASYCMHRFGLENHWGGRVWLNPPYSREAIKWLKKLADHGDGIALIFARTETSWFCDQVWRRASGILFLEGRIHFHLQNGERAKANAGAPSCLAAYGNKNVDALGDSRIKGFLVTKQGLFENRR